MNDIFNGVTSLTELNVQVNKKTCQEAKLKKKSYLQEINAERRKKMPTPKVDDFSDKDLVQSSFDFWKFKEDKELIGVFVRWENDNYGEHPVIESEGDEIHLPNLTALNGKLKAGKVEKGNKVKIVYVGDEKGKKSGRVYENFQVFIKKK